MNAPTHDSSSASTANWAWLDRGTVPAPVEDDSIAAWEEFEACTEAFERLPRPRRAVPALRPMAQLRVAEGEFLMTLTETLSADDVMRIARRNDRVCPLPAVWRKMYMLLPVARQGEQVSRAAFPLDRLSWQVTSDLNKRLRLREQIEWAQAHGGLRELRDFLLGLNESEWHHHAPDGWPQL
ncbi:MAG TPA: hypothetical protein VFE82_17000 [Ramlibacter sp.]|jgi:hypothetical protein|uniref:hypothetical protein n=1 Tax=Ramlibacter sp. TaxID=1917967 RepID=UPI002D3991EC|nr:hypothetical protein [Ramlibacter sp.]HZY20171.1 hypothetical protein [Ramlibacter sp.]